MEERLWTLSGVSFGYRMAGRLFTLAGQQVGTFRGDEIYGTDGRYLGELAGRKRLGTRISKKGRAWKDTPSMKDRGGPLINDWEDFPHPDSFM